MSRFQTKIRISLEWEKDFSGPFQALKIRGLSVQLKITKPGTIVRKGRLITSKVAEAIGLDLLAVS